LESFDKGVKFRTRKNQQNKYELMKNTGTREHGRGGGRGESERKGWGRKSKKGGKRISLL